MSTGTRRLLLFIGMVSTGLVLIFVLSDEDIRPGRKDAVSEPNPQTATTGVRVQGPDDADGDTRIDIPDEFVFTILAESEDDAGAIVQRPAYRVHMLSGGPDGSEFLANHPTIHILDIDTGSEKGWLAADEARFALSGSVGGTSTLDPSQLGADDFTLNGNVRGEFPLQDGDIGKLAAERLEVDGDIVLGPGIVTWMRDAMKIEGVDFTWDSETGRMNYERDTVVMVEPSDQSLGFDLFAPGGLTWTFPRDAEDANAESWGELRGRVSGVATDGSRVGADTMLVKPSSVQLHGASVYERREGDDVKRVTARHITVRADDDGVFTFAEADGDVRVLSAPFAVVPSWMIAEYLVLEHDRARTPEHATMSRDEVTATGEGMSWDASIGRLDYSSAAEFRLDAAGDASLAGLSLRAPGGMTLLVPPESLDAASDVTGELRGRVSGTMPDGTNFESDVVYVDGPSHTLTLEGRSWFELHAETGGSTRLDAGRVTLRTDELGELALISAEGDVVLIDTPVELLPTRLVTQQLEVEGERTTSPGEVIWTRGDDTVIGTAMTWDGTTGQLRFERDAIITVVDAEGASSMQLHGEGGLLWNMPVDALSPVQAGHGELAGPVTGRTGDGSSLEAGHLIYDGPTGTVSLSGGSVVEVASDAAPMRVESESLEVEGFGSTEGTRIRTDEPVAWAREDLSGSGVGLDWNQGTGELSLREDVEVDMHDANAGRSLHVAADGGLTWIDPPTATGADGRPTGAESVGRGELRDRVRGTFSDGGVFHADVLTLDERTGRLRLGGACHYERKAPDGSFWVTATRSLELELDAGGEVSWVEAVGDVDAWIWPSDNVEPGTDSTHLVGDRLVLDRSTQAVTLWGNAVFDESRAGRGTRIDAVEMIEAHVVEGAGDLSRVHARGDVNCRSNTFKALGQRFDWNLDDDYATLVGDCRVEFEGGSWMTAEEIELWPEQERWHVIRSAFHSIDEQN